jgi:hypothetical protein
MPISSLLHMTDCYLFEVLLDSSPIKVNGLRKVRDVHVLRLVSFIEIFDKHDIEFDKPLTEHYFRPKFMQ